MPNYISTVAPFAVTHSRKASLPKPGIPVDTCILIVDNDRPSSVALAFMLSVRGYEEIRSVRSAARAVTIAENFRPGIVFLDIDLPGTDPLELARSLRRGSRQPALRIIALTNSVEHPTREDAREAGFERYLVKPCEQSEIDKILRLPADVAA
jgi:CheY-like chemotaxis protein